MISAAAASIGECRPGLPAIAGGVPVRPASRPVRFGPPSIGEPEMRAVTECLASGWIGEGARVAEFERRFAEYKSAPYAAAVSSCTAALHLSLVALGIRSGDEVIVPAMTFCATANQVVHAGATPVFVDCNPVTFNIEATEIERRITPRTRTIIVVHMCGRSAEMADIAVLARRRKLHLIEDCAHAIETTYHGQPSGLWGDVGCFSFYATKNLTTGDGGMVISRNGALVARIKRLSCHGMDRNAWQRRNSGALYKIMEAGFKYNMTDIEAALGLAQLAGIEERWHIRQMLWSEYGRLLAGLPLELPPEPESDSRHALHLYTPLLRTELLTVDRDSILKALAAENVGAGVHYRPVHVQPYYRRRFGIRPNDYPCARRVGARTLSLPLSAALDSRDVADVCEALERVLRYYSKQ